MKEMRYLGEYAALNLFRFRRLDAQATKQNPVLLILLHCDSTLGRSKSIENKCENDTRRNLAHTGENPAAVGGAEREGGDGGGAVDDLRRGEGSGGWTQGVAEFTVRRLVGRTPQVFIFKPTP